MTESKVVNGWIAEGRAEGLGEGYTAVLLEVLTERFGPCRPTWRAPSAGRPTWPTSARG